MPVLLLTMIVATGSTGCREPRGDQAPSGDICINPPKEIRQTYDCLRAWHSRGAYTAMRPYLDPNTGEDLIDLLVAMDELLAANAGTQAAIRQACPELDPRRYDLAYIEQYMGFLSKDVEYVRERDKGDQAVVVVQVGGRMPLEELQFRRYRETRGPSRWIYLPGSDVPQLVPLIREVAGALSQITLVLSTSKKATPEEVRNEFEIRIQRRIMKKVAAMMEKAAASQPD